MGDHIRIDPVRPRIQYVADGEQSTFTFPFAVFKASDLLVYLDNEKQSGGYSVTGEGSSTGGTVSLTAAPTAGRVVTLERDLPLARTTDFQTDGIIRAKTLNDELDYQTAVIQQLSDALDRSPRRAPTSTSTVDLTLPDPVGGRALKWNAAGTGLANSDTDPDAAATTAVAAATSAAADARTATTKASEAASSALAAAHAVPWINAAAAPYNAKGDGVADDTAAIVAAIEAANGGMVFLPAGAYRITAPLDSLTAKEIRLVGQSAAYATHAVISTAAEAGKSKIVCDACALVGSWASGTDTLTWTQQLKHLSNLYVVARNGATHGIILSPLDALIETCAIQGFGRFGLFTLGGVLFTLRKVALTNNGTALAPSGTFGGTDYLAGANIRIEPANITSGVSGNGALAGIRTGAANATTYLFEKVWTSSVSSTYASSLRGILAYGAMNLTMVGCGGYIGNWFCRCTGDITDPWWETYALGGVAENDISTAQPAADITYGQFTNHLTASAGVFSAGDVGKYIRGLGDAFFEITAYTSATDVTVRMISGSASAYTHPSGSWTLYTNHAISAVVVDGQMHLTGQVYYTGLIYRFNTGTYGSGANPWDWWGKRVPDYGRSFKSGTLAAGANVDIYIDKPYGCTVGDWLVLVRAELNDTASAMYSSAWIMSCRAQETQFFVKLGEESSNVTIGAGGLTVANTYRYGGGAYALNIANGYAGSTIKYTVEAILLSAGEVGRMNKAGGSV